MAKDPYIYAYIQVRVALRWAGARAPALLKGRMRVRIYLNLRTGLWSLLHRRRVIAHETNVTITGCRFVVSEAQRQRVLRERCRQVHAWVEG